MKRKCQANVNTKKQAFQVNRTYPKILRNRKQRIERRLQPKNWEDQPWPMFQASNIHYEMAARDASMNCGGIGAIHLLAQRLGLPDDIDRSLELLKVHLPYHESDHVLNLTYNLLAGGQRLEDIELRRQDEVFLNGLGAERIPDPTTAGDFTRRFSPEDIVTLQECINRARLTAWKVQPEGFLKEAFIDVDGTIAGTYGECKQGMDLSYKGIWGYAPLVVSLANSKEVLYVANRPGNASSQSGSVEWIDRAVALAEALGNGVWKPFEREPKHEILTEPRPKAFRYKEQVVVERQFENQKLVGEALAEIAYQPHRCRQQYRVIILRKNISVQKGEKALFDEVRYFFYITNRKDKPAKVVGLANGRCDQENVIEQLKNGANAMRMPVADLVSNWAYMVMAALAWNLKAWYGLLVPNRERGLELVKMEFRRFLNAVMLLPCQVVRTARRVIYRLLGYNRWLVDFFATWERLQRLVTG